MSYKMELSGLRRDADVSLTQQLIDRFSAAIDAGELEPGEKLPTTRALAEEAGINHLTAARVYRRLAELGYVTASVGRGTFVRSLTPARGRAPRRRLAGLCAARQAIDLWRPGPERRLPPRGRARHGLALHRLAVAARLPHRGDRGDHRARVRGGGRRGDLLPARRGAVRAARRDRALRRRGRLGVRPRGDPRDLGRAPGRGPCRPRADRAGRRGRDRVADLPRRAARRCATPARA